MRCLGLLLLLAACPPKNPQTAAGKPDIPNGPPCPSADGVFTASFVTNESGGRSGWVMPLSSMQVDPGASARVPEYQNVDIATASASGMPAPPTGNLWLMTAQGAPCKATAGKAYAAKLPGPPESMSYGVELDGCPGPQDPQESGGLVFIADQAPTGCQLAAPRPIASRMGEIDQQKVWHRPTTETPIPPALAALLPPHDCKAPGCETLWAVGEVALGDKPVAWAGAINWVTIDDPNTPCTWKTERYSGFWIPGADGKPVKVEEGQTHPLVLSAVLIDRTGPKALLAEGPGEYATYDLTVAPGQAKLARHVQWMLAPNDAWDMVDHLGPPCEHATAAPAPLPKDAKPQSPY
jgi:hypothetical protein